MSEPWEDFSEEQGGVATAAAPPEAAEPWNEDWSSVSEGMGEEPPPAPPEESQGVLPRLQFPFKNIVVPPGTPLKEQLKLGWEDINRPMVTNLGPLLSLATPFELFLPERAKQGVQGYRQTMGEFISGFTSPFMLATLGLGKLFHRAAKSPIPATSRVGQVGERLIAAGFTEEMIRNMGPAAQELATAFESNDPKRIGAAATGAFLNSIMPVLTGKYAVSPFKKPPPPPPPGGPGTVPIQPPEIMPPPTRTFTREQVVRMRDFPRAMRELRVQAEDEGERAVAEEALGKQIQEAAATDPEMKELTENQLRIMHDRLMKALQFNQIAVERPEVMFRTQAPAPAQPGVMPPPPQRIRRPVPAAPPQPVEVPSALQRSPEAPVRNVPPQPQQGIQAVPVQVVPGGIRGGGAPEAGSSRNVPSPPPARPTGGPVVLPPDRFVTAAKIALKNLGVAPSQLENLLSGQASIESVVPPAARAEAKSILDEYRRLQQTEGGRPPEEPPPAAAPAPVAPKPPAPAAPASEGVESTEAIVARTKVGLERDAAFAERAAKLKQLAQSLKPGDVVIFDDGTRMVVDQVNKNGDIWAYPEGKTADQGGFISLLADYRIERRSVGRAAPAAPAAAAEPIPAPNPPVSGEKIPSLSKGHRAPLPADMPDWMKKAVDDYGINFNGAESFEDPRTGRKLDYFRGELVDDFGTGGVGAGISWSKTATPAEFAATVNKMRASFLEAKRKPRVTEATLDKAIQEAKAAAEPEPQFMGFPASIWTEEHLRKLVASGQKSAVVSQANRLQEQLGIKPELQQTVKEATLLKHIKQILDARRKLYREERAAADAANAAAARSTAAPAAPDAPEPAKPEMTKEEAADAEREAFIQSLDQLQDVEKKDLREVLRNADPKDTQDIKQEWVQVNADRKAYIEGGSDEIPVAKGTPGAQTKIAVKDVFQIPADQIVVNPELMQFKRMDDSASGVNRAERIEGEWDPVKAGNLLLWEPKNPAQYGLKGGQKYLVANGHHRVEFGTRSGVDSYNAQIMREVDGFSANDARREAAEANIADGKGTIYDAVRFIRNTAEALGANEALAQARRVGVKGRTAADIAISASPDLYGSFINEKITPEQTVAIAKAAPGNAELQALGLHTLLSGEDALTAVNTMKDMSGEVRTGRMEQGDFLRNDAAIQAAIARGKVAAQFQRDIDKDIAAISGAVKQPERAAKGEVKVGKGAAEKLQELREMRQRWESWDKDPELHAKVVEAAGQKPAPPPPEAPPPAAPAPKPPKPPAPPPAAAAPPAPEAKGVFKVGDRVDVGTLPMNREGVVAAPGPRGGYFVKTNLGEIFYEAKDVRPIKETPPSAPVEGHPMDALLGQIPGLKSPFKGTIESGGDEWVSPKMTKEQLDLLAKKAWDVGWTMDSYSEPKRAKGRQGFFRKLPTQEEREINALKSRLGRLELILEQPELTTAKPEEIRAEIEKVKAAIAGAEGSPAEKAEPPPKPPKPEPPKLSAKDVQRIDGQINELLAKRTAETPLSPSEEKLLRELQARRGQEDLIETGIGDSATIARIRDLRRQADQLESFGRKGTVSQEEAAFEEAAKLRKQADEIERNIPKTPEHRKKEAARRGELDLADGSPGRSIGPGAASIEEYRQRGIFKTDRTTPLPDFNELDVSQRAFASPWGFERIPILGVAMGGVRRLGGYVNNALATYFGERAAGRAISSALANEYEWIDRQFDVLDGRITNITPRKPNASLYVSDVFEALMRDPEAYKLNAEQRAAFNAIVHLEEEFQRLQKEYRVGKNVDNERLGSDQEPMMDLDVDPEDRPYFTRVVIARPGGIRKGLARGEAIGARPYFEKPRMFDTEAEGWAKGYRYEDSISRRLGTRAERLYKRIADKRLATNPLLGGQTRESLVSGLKETYADELRTGKWDEDRIERMADTIQRRGFVDQPAFWDLIFPEETAEHLRKVFPNRTSSARQAAASVNNALKGLWLGFDWGVGTIQGQLSLFAYPDLWAKANYNSIRAMFSRDFFPEYVRRNLEVIREMAQMGSSVGRLEEYVAGLGEREWLVGGPRKAGRALERLGIPGAAKAGRIVSEVPEAFGRQFQVFLDTAKVEIWKAIRNKPRPEERVNALQAVERLMYSAPMERIGVSPGRAMAERVLLLAPSYYRGFLDLAASVFERGVPGSVARHAIGAYLLGGTTLFFVVSKLMGVDDKEILRRMNPANANFMMWKVNIGGKDVEFGIGGILRSVIRLGGSLVKTAMQDPEGFLTLNPQRNPITRFYRGHAGPIVGLGWDQITARDYMGRDTDLRDLRRTIYPLSIRTMIPEPNRPVPSEAEGPITFAGLNVYTEPGRQNEARVRQDARTWMRFHPDPKIRNRLAAPGGSYPPSQYNPLRFALDANDLKRAYTEYRKLIRNKGGTREAVRQIDQMMNPKTVEGFNKPFGEWGRDLEDSFYDSLNTDERKAYARALRERAELFARYQRMLQTHGE